MNTDETKEALQVIEAGLVAVLAGVRMLGAAPEPEPGPGPTPAPSPSHHSRRPARRHDE